MLGGERKKPGFPVEIALDVVTTAGGDRVPLVDRDHERASRVEDVTRQRRVLLGDAFFRVEHQYDDVRVLDRLQCLYDRKLLDSLENLSAPEHAGRVAQRIRAPASLD